MFVCMRACLLGSFGLGEIMLGEGYALSSNGEGITSKNLDNIQQYIGMVDITTTSKIAHPPNAKPHHLTFQQHEAPPPRT